MKKYISCLVFIIVCFLTSEVGATKTIKNPFALHPKHRQKIANSLNDISVDAPLTATDTCVEGQIAWDASYIYVCIAANTWKRTEITTWLTEFLLLESGDFFLLESGDKLILE